MYDFFLGGMECFRTLAAPQKVDGTKQKRRKIIYRASGDKSLLS